eukprot:179449_1
MNIDGEFLLNLYKQQQGKCYYSNISLNLQRLCDWQCSLERLDQNIGYNKENVALIALEFNHAEQWTLQKILEIPNLVHETSEIHITDEMIYDALNTKWRGSGHHNKQYEAHFKMVQDQKYYYCHGCQIFKSRDQFYPKGVTQCKNCRIQNELLKLETLSGKVSGMLGNAKSNARRRNSFQCAE